MTMRSDDRPADQALWTLESARTAVRATIAAAREACAVDDTVAEQWEERLAATRDVFEVDQLVSDTPALDVQLCRFPGCFHPRRAATGAGRAPAYCDVVRDARGEPAHNAVRSMRMRARIKAGERPTAASIETEEPAGERVVSMARATIPVQVARVETLVTDLQAEIIRALTNLRDQVELVGDDEARLAEIDAIRHDTAKEVEALRGERLTADTTAREARTDAAAARRELDEAIAAAEDAAQRAERIETDAAAQAERDAQAVTDARTNAEQTRTRANEEIREAKAAAKRAEATAAEHRRRVNEDRDQTLAQWQTDHDTEIARIRTDAHTQVEEIRTDHAAQLEAIRTSADARVTEATNAADQARRDQAAAAAAAEQANTHVAAAQATTQALHTQATQLRADIERLQARLDEAEQRHRDELDRIRGDYQQQRHEDQQQWQTLLQQALGRTNQTQQHEDTPPSA